MRRTALLVLAAALVLPACTGGDPTIEESPTPSDTTSATASPSETATASDSGLPTDGPTTPTESEGGSEPGTEADMALTSDLNGAVVVPGPGDPSGSGSFSATIVLNEASGELCYQLEVADLSSEVSAAHIREGAEGRTGPVHIELRAPIGGPVDECLTVNATELVPMMDDPTQFYVEVYTQGHPDGAVRGQLEEQ